MPLLFCSSGSRGEPADVTAAEHWGSPKGEREKREKPNGAQETMPALGGLQELDLFLGITLHHANLHGGCWDAIQFNPCLLSPHGAAMWGKITGFLPLVGEILSPGVGGSRLGMMGSALKGSQLHTVHQGHICIRGEAQRLYPLSEVHRSGQNYR